MLHFNLPYYVLAEVVACILTAILSLNILVALVPTERRYRLFLYSCAGCFLTALFDILSVLSIYNHTPSTVFLSVITTTIFFIVIPLVPVSILAYTVEIAFTYRQRHSFVTYITWIVYYIYVFFVLINIKTGWIFYFNADYDYVAGKFINLTYIYKLICFVAIEIAAFINKKYMSFRLYMALSLSPFISILVMFIQVISPKMLMSGFSSFSAILLAYITIQADMAEYDFLTGLMTQHKLEKHVEMRPYGGVLYLISIENLHLIQMNMEVEQFNSLLLKISREFSKRFGRKSYFIASNKFAAIAKSMDIVEAYSAEISKFLQDIHLNYELSVPSPLEFYPVAVELPIGEKSFANIMETANDLFNKAKKDASHSLLISDESIVMERERRKYLHKILKREMRVDSEQLVVYYQPIYSLKDGKFMYMEALARLINTELGNIPPSEFIQVAENRGMIEQLGNIIFEKVCDFISKNRETVQAVSVNFSVYQIINPYIVDFVMKKIHEYNLSPSNIIMEITESIFIDNFEVAYKNMIALAAKGIKFYLDDFGTGYSNLANVIGLPFSTIKMDRSLVLMMEHSEKNFNLFSNLVSTFKDADLKVLVEGVETKKQNELVRATKVDYIQGYLYSRPKSPEECIQLLKDAASKENQA